MAGNLRVCKSCGQSYKWVCRCKRRARNARRRAGAGRGRRQNWAAAAAVAELDQRASRNVIEKAARLETEAQALVEVLDALATRSLDTLQALRQADEDDVRTIATMLYLKRTGQPYQRPPVWLLSRALEEAREIKATQAHRLGSA